MTENINDTGIICYENLDPIAIKWLLEQDELHQDLNENEKIKKILGSILKAYKRTKFFKSQYLTKKELGRFGRIYSYHQATEKRLTFGGLSCLSRPIRGFSAAKDNIDIDIKKCHWFLIKHFIYKNETWKTEHIDNFLITYDKVIEYIVENELYSVDEDSKDQYDSPIDKAKKTIFSILYTSPKCLKDYKKLIIDNCKPFQLIHNMVYNDLFPRLKYEYTELVELLVKQYKKNEWNLDGKILSHILQHVEKLLIVNIIDFF
jgi:hypothetical protein